MASPFSRQLIEHARRRIVPQVQAEGQARGERAVLGPIAGSQVDPRAAGGALDRMRGGVEADRLVVTGRDGGGDQQAEEHDGRAPVRLDGLPVGLADLAHRADGRASLLADLVRGHLPDLFGHERGPVRRQDVEDHGDTLAVAVRQRAEQADERRTGHVRFRRVAHLPRTAHARIMSVMVPTRLAGDRSGVLPCDPRPFLVPFERVLCGRIVRDAHHAADLVDGQHAGRAPSRVGDAADQAGYELADPACRVVGFEEPAGARVDVAEREREDHAAGRAAGRVQAHDLCHRPGGEFGRVCDGASGQVTAEAYARIR